MNYSKGKDQLNAMREQIADIRADMRRLRGEIAPEPVPDHTFETADGPVTLGALFAGHDDLLVIHNMGADCAYCTLWADGYNGVYDHLVRRAAFIVVSPDPPHRQRQYAAARGWRFPMVTDTDAAFSRRMGYVSPSGKCLPGISALQRRGDIIMRVTDVAEHPFDDYCALWHLFDLLPGGAENWSPRITPRS